MKYHNKKYITPEGDKYDSKGEYNYYQYLLQQQKLGNIKNLQRQVKFELVPKQLDKITNKFKYHPISYIADYVYTDTLTNTQHVVDYKGYQTTEFKIKRKLFYQKYQYDIEIVK